MTLPKNKGVWQAVLAGWTIGALLVMGFLGGAIGILPQGVVP